MNSVTDESIFQSGIAATILRTPNNIATYVTKEITGADAGRRQLDPLLDFFTAFKFMTDSTITTGDLVLIENDYYLVMAIEERMSFGEIEDYKGTCYKCNSVISIYSTHPTTGKDTVLVKENVHCLITQVRSQEWDTDRALALPNRSYRGAQQPFQVYLKASEGLNKTHSIVDQAGRRFKVGKDFDVFIADNIAQTEVLWERT